MAFSPDAERIDEAGWVAISGKMMVLKLIINTHAMDAIRPAQIMQRWSAIRYEVLPYR
jgi:hypothetical protein